MRKILDIIEAKKDSPRFIWKFLYKLKYGFFIIFRRLNYFLLKLLLGEKIKVFNFNNFRFKIFNFYRNFFWQYPFISKGVIIIKKSEDEIIVIPTFGFAQGEFEAIDFYFREYLPQQGDLVIDGGAYQGVFTIVLSLLVGEKGKVISFEPDPFNFEKLKNNIQKHNLGNVVLINKGLFNKNCLLYFKSYGNQSSHLLHYGAGIFRHLIKKKAKLIDVNFVSIDSELKKLGIKKVNYIKMDIEGAEVEAVKGCKKVMKQNNVHFAIASYHKIQGKETCYQLEKIFKKMGYFAETQISFHTTTYAHKKNNC